MKPFAYHRASSIEEACALLARHGETARILAGGQSLLNMMKLRFAAPEHLVDGSRIETLRRVSAEAGSGEARQRVGAMVTYAELGRSAAARHGIVADALLGIADLQVQNLGTLGGSCCQADPYGDMPGVVLALAAELEARSALGGRRIAADDFFRGPLETALAPDEMLVAVHLPAPRPGTGTAYEKFAWRRGDYAIVSIAAVVTLGPGESCSQCRLVAGGLGLGPVRLGAGERLLAGAPLSDPAIAAAAAAAAADCTPEPDPLYGGADYKRALVETLTIRCLTRAAERARGTGGMA